MPIANITADSKPVWCIFGFGSDCWGGQEFILWHKAMKSKYGKDEANYRFVKEWENSPFINTGIGLRTTNEDFKKYAKENGFYQALFDGIGVLVKPLSAATSIVSGASDVVSDAGSGIASTVKVASKILPVVLILAGLGVAVYVYKQYKSIA